MWTSVDDDVVKVNKNYSDAENEEIEMHFLYSIFPSDACQTSFPILCYILNFTTFFSSSSA